MAKLVAYAALAASIIFAVGTVVYVEATSQYPRHKVERGTCRPIHPSRADAHYYGNRLYWTISWQRAEVQYKNVTAIASLVTPWLLDAGSYNISNIVHGPCWIQPAHNSSAYLYNPNKYHNPADRAKHQNHYALYVLLVPPILLAAASVTYLIVDRRRTHQTVARQRSYSSIENSNYYAS